MAEYLIQGETMTALADQARKFTGNTDTLNAAEVAEVFSRVRGSISDDGEYSVRAISARMNPIFVDENYFYYTPAVKSGMYDSGMIFALPTTPSINGLVIQTWVSPVPVIGNFVTVGNQSMDIGEVLTTIDGEMWMNVTDTANQTISINLWSHTTTTNCLSGVTSIDWGDGTITDVNTDVDSIVSHTYAMIPGTIIKIYGVHSIIGEFISNGADKVIEIVIPPSVTNISGVSNNYFFSNMQILETLCIADGDDRLYCSESMFSNINIKNIIIPDRIIGSLRCSSAKFETAIFGTGVSDINCSSCTSLVNATICNPNIEIVSFQDCTSLENITLPDRATIIYGYTFTGCTSLKSITLPDGVTSIGDSAFYGCESLASITIPASVTSIGDYAFYGCKSLASVIYKGTAEQWENVVIGYYNEKFTNAIITFEG